MLTVNVSYFITTVGSVFILACSCHFQSSCTSTRKVQRIACTYTDAIHFPIDDMGLINEVLILLCPHTHFLHTIINTSTVSLYTEDSIVTNAHISKVDK